MRWKSSTSAESDPSGYRRLRQQAVCAGLACVALLCLGGCATARPALELPNPCADLYSRLDALTAAHGVGLGYPAKVPAFPGVRLTRFLADHSGREMGPDGVDDWLERVVALDLSAREVEAAALSESALASLRGTLDDLPEEHGRSAPAALRYCAVAALDELRASPEAVAALRDGARVPATYQPLLRVLGLYPLTSMPVRRGIAAWHEETHQSYALPLESLTERGTLTRYRPAATSAAAPGAGLKRDALGMPAPDAETLERLLATHAPVWEIDTTGAHDLPGRPFFAARHQPTVAPDPVAYHYVSYTRWQDEPLLQLNYLIWFSERPKDGALDLVGGRLDGLVWRVTLGADGRPLFYDSVHPCGCYHLFFPTAGMRLRPEAAELPEPPLVPQTIAPAPAGQRLVIRVDSGRHYIQRVYADLPSGAPYRLQGYESLYSVAGHNGDSQSLFARNGLVPGTARLERWVLWPMGIPSPGAMRERGYHATAFVGRRHFEDPALLDMLFEPR